MIMVKPPKGSTDHRIAKMIRPVKGCDPTRELLAISEVGRFPGHLLPRLDQAGGPACDRPFAMFRLTRLMHVDAAGEIENLFHRRRDFQEEFDPGHVGSKQNQPLEVNPPKPPAKKVEFFTPQTMLGCCLLESR